MTFIIFFSGGVKDLGRKFSFISPFAGRGKRKKRKKEKNETAFSFSARENL
jgi:hypothetical protein